MDRLRPQQNSLRLLDSFGAPNRIGEADPPTCGSGINLHQVAGNCCGHIPFLGHHVEVHTCAEDFVAVFILWCDLFQNEGRIVEHSQLEIAARGEDILFPARPYGIGGYWRRSMRAFIAIHVTSKKAPAVTASIMSEPKL